MISDKLKTVISRPLRNPICKGGLWEIKYGSSWPKIYEEIEMHRDCSLGSIEIYSEQTPVHTFTLPIYIIRPNPRYNNPTEPIPAELVFIGIRQGPTIHLDNNQTTYGYWFQGVELETSQVFYLLVDFEPAAKELLA